MLRPMKHSGVEWIGFIPADWKINNVFQLFTQVKNRNSNLQEQNLLSLSYGKIKRKNIDTTDGLLPESFDGYNIIEADDIILRLTDLQNDHKSLRVGLAEERGIVTSAYLTIRNRSESLAKYLYYYLHSFDIAKGFYGMGAGVRQNLNWNEMKRLQILSPPLEEQQRIADYLDEECARIDNVIEKTRASIVEYKKLKQAIITRAVTKGMRPARPMKDSGVEWLGDIPADWTALALKYLCTMQSGKNLVSEQIADTGNYPVYGGNGQRGFFDDYNCEGKKLLVGRQGALCGNVHRVTDKFWATEHAVITENTEHCDIDFLYYLLIGMNLNQYVSSTAAQPGLAVSTIQNIKTCLPPLEEQKEIAAYLDGKTAAIDSLIARKNQLVTELESLKKSLIFEYVTGKREII